MLKYLVKSMVEYLKKIRFIFKYNGTKKTFKFIFNIFSKDINLFIYDYYTKLRFKTPDFKVALESLGFEFDILQNFLNQDFDGLIVDAGGYIGTAAMNFSRRFPNAKITTIEPSLDNYEILKSNIQNYKNVTSIHAALTASDSKKVNLYDRKTGQWGYSIIDSGQQSLIGESKTVTLSEICDNNLLKGLIKIDIEGYEYFLLNHAQEDLNQFNVIIIELHERILKGIKDSFESFNQHNSRLSFKTNGEKFISIRKDYICK